MNWPKGLDYPQIGTLPDLCITNLWFWEVLRQSQTWLRMMKMDLWNLYINSLIFEFMAACPKIKILQKHDCVPLTCVLDNLGIIQGESTWWSILSIHVLQYCHCNCTGCKFNIWYKLKMFWGFLFDSSQVLPVDTWASRIKGGVLSLNTIMVPHPLRKVMKNHPWKMVALFWQMW